MARKTSEYSFFASGDFCCLPIIFANSYDPDQDQHLMVFLKDYFEKIDFEKKNQQMTKNHEKLIF